MFKKLDIFLLKSYAGPLIATFFISLFVLLMQFLWKYIDDLVGKGLESSVIAEFMFYASVSLIPMALPLAILLASIMTFGNLGEKFELTAIKASGISLQRIMQPLVIVTFIISILAFVVANNVIPYVNLKMSALSYSIRNQRPELNIKPHIFNNDIENFSIRISRKDPVTNMMYDFVIYDHTQNKPNNVCIVADSGSMKVTDNGRYMIVTMYNGIQYEEMIDNKRVDYPFRKDHFEQQTFVFNLSGFDFNKTDENLFRNNYQVKNVNELEESTDSLQQFLDRRMDEFQRTLTTKYYLKSSVHIEYTYSDSIKSHRKTKVKSASKKREDNLYEAEVVVKDTAYLREDSIINLRIATKTDSIYNHIYNIKPSELPIVVSLDSILDAMSKEERNRVLSKTKEYATEAQSIITRNVEDFSQRKRTIAKYQNAWHQKFTLSFACLIFFFIGAPLGAIIRKGGFGLPIVISVIIFLIYYMISTMGMKMSRDGMWLPWQGMWFSSIIILPLGVFFTYKATVDAQLFNKEAWLLAFNKIGSFFSSFQKLSDTYGVKGHHPLRNALQNLAIISGLIGIGFSRTPMKKTALIFGAVTILFSLIVHLLNRKFNYKSKFAILSAILGIAAIIMILK